MPPSLAAGTLTETFATFVASLLAGGLALAAGTWLVLGDADVVGATVTAAIGAVVWAVFDGVPLLGPLLALALWLVVLRWRFEASWVGTAVIGGVAWIVAIVVVGLSALLGLPVEEAIGIPAA